MPENCWSTYHLRHQLFSLGEDFWIQNAGGENVYKADSKAMSLRETFVVADVNDNELATIEAKLLSLQPTMKILRGGKLSATVKTAIALCNQQLSLQAE